MGLTSRSKKIQLLPEHIIDQIKAGEVIERPSTLLKELLENSIDAQATEIEIEIVNNGLDLVSVKDNGKGIDFEDLDLAFCRHATSKIERFEDIYNLFTYGFRGEALASIASISKVTCVTNTKGSPEGLVKINGGEVVALDQDSEPLETSGLAMFIRDLFYNTPARMKFIQSKTSEKNQLDKIVKAFLLTQPEVKISLKWDERDKKVYQAWPKEQLKRRVEETIKRNRQLTLLEHSSEYDEISFRIFLSLESSRGSSGKSQFIFVNDRLIQDVQIHKVILNSAAPLWEPGETGSYCAYINLPSDRLDVNIHPNKTQVKFFEAPKIFSLVSSAIREGLSKSRQETGAWPKTEQENLGMPRFPGDDGFKDVSYRKFEFDSFDSSLDDYFTRLDRGKSRASPQDEPATPMEGLFQSLARIKDVLLIKSGEKVFLIRTPELMSARMVHALTQEERTPLPLLVSQPLKLERKLSDQEVAELANLGFEVDNIGQNDYVLRTFPQCLRNFPYKEHLEKYLDQEQKLSSIMEGLTKGSLIPEQDNWSHYHRKAVEAMTLPVLLELNIAVELTYDKLKKIL